ncbi:MAG TPA: hypothetical protein VGC13_04945 [Longimicrobium sp.]|jgi:hypothetical protein|uniref:hypothetical protein n=1 Tax=Longimicrobium sp. TaxID=2029185 RepID=UPI002ED8229D
MATPYSITITIPDETVTTLKSGGYQLYGFKGVRGPRTGKPLVWFATEDYSETTALTWSEEYFAYTSRSVKLTPSTRITATGQDAVNLGQLVTVAAGGVGTVSQGPDPRAIAILNAASPPTDFVCGLSQPNGIDPKPLPICAFPLPAGMEDLIVPIAQVFLMFASAPVNTGTVIEQSYGWGALVDLTADHDMEVKYDLKVPTQWVQVPGITASAPNTDLIPLLINSDNT